MRAGALRHYDEKYAHETSAAPSAELLVARSSSPVTRYEACVGALLDRFRGGDLIEIGAGSGLLARSLLAAGLPCRHYVATEFSRSRLAGLERALPDPQVDVRLLDVEQPGDEHLGAYDTVVMLALIEHLFDPMRAMRNVRSMLRPGGFVYIDTPNIAKWTRRLKLLVGRFPSTASREEGLATYDGAPVDLHDEGHLHYFTYRSLSRMLVERCGFTRVVKVPYASAPHVFGRRIGHELARSWPELFAELALVAYVQGDPSR
jgi:SAM-dependent methyltransferase